MTIFDREWVDAGGGFARGLMYAMRSFVTGIRSKLECYDGDLLFNDNVLFLYMMRYLLDFKFYLL